MEFSKFKIGQPLGSEMCLRLGKIRETLSTPPFRETPTTAFHDVEMAAAASVAPSRLKMLLGTFASPSDPTSQPRSSFLQKRDEMIS